MQQTRERDFGKAVLAGMVGGLIGTVVMTQFQSSWSKASDALQSACPKAQSGRKQQGSKQENASMKAAGKIAELAGRKLSFEQKKKLGPVIDYAFGTLQGGAYGAATELLRVEGGIVAGLAFGGALFALADEFAVPKLGLSGKPSEYPISSHVYALLSHLVYGFSSEIARRGLRSAV